MGCPLLPVARATYAGITIAIKSSEVGCRFKLRHHDDFSLRDSTVFSIWGSIALNALPVSIVIASPGGADLALGGPWLVAFGSEGTYD